MAARLTVIMVHAPPATASAQQVAESVVGELIGRPGIDLTLIGRLDHILDSSTDRLTLDSVSGDTVVLDWRKADDLVDALGKIGFHGVRAKHAGDPNADPPTNDATTASQRRIYAYDLNEHNDAAQICKELTAMLANRQVRTFSLAAPGSRPEPLASRSDSHPSDAALPELPSPVAHVSISPSAPTQPSAPVANPAAASTPQRTRPTHTELDLDDLVDQLDALDP